MSLKTANDILSSLGDWWVDIPYTLELFESFT